MRGKYEKLLLVEIRVNVFISRLGLESSRGTQN